MSDSPSHYNQYPVHLGSWVNWSRGRVLGATLTMTRENGNLLIAFTALFVGFVSSRFWRIVCFALHRYFSSPESRDGLHHQRQVILRNASSAELSAWTLIQLLLAWRSSAERPFVRTLPVLSGASICIIGFALAGGFSSQVATAVGDEVLIANSECAYRRSSPTDLAVALNNIRSMSLMGSDSANYAQQCYYGGDGVASTSSSQSTTTMFDCEVFAVDRLPTMVSQAEPCPFPNRTICKSQQSNLFLDTGYIDSHVHLGINSPPQERLLFRQTYTCAPLQTRVNGSHYTRQRASPHFNFTQYLYGDGSWNISSSSNNPSRFGFTYETFSMDTQYPSPSEFSGGRMSDSKGSLMFFLALMNNGTVSPDSSFEQRPELLRPDGDISVIFFSGNGLLYADKSTDDWYGATKPRERIHYNQGPRKQVYLPDEAASPLGCVSQYQFCRPSPRPDSNKTCGILGSLNDAYVDAAPLFDLSREDLDSIASDDVWDPLDIVTGDDGRFSKVAKLFARFVMYWTEQSDPGELLGWAGPDVSLLSSQTIYWGVQMESRDDQWKRDVTHWWSTFLAMLQIRFTESGLGSSQTLGENNSSINETIIQLPEFLCNNQKIRSRRHTSFSIFGICFIYVVGGLLTIMSYVLEPLFTCVDKRREKKRTEKNSYYYRRDIEWNVNDVLHLHCLSIKPLMGDLIQDDEGRGRGIGTARWTKFDDAIPIIQPADYLLKPLGFERENSTENNHPYSETPRKNNNTNNMNMSAAEDVSGRSEDNTVAAGGSPDSGSSGGTVMEILVGEQEQEQGQEEEQDEDQTSIPAAVESCDGREPSGGNHHHHGLPT